MVMPILTQTLPTIVGMGVTAHTIEIMFKKPSSGKKVDAVVVGVASSKIAAEKFAAQYRKALKKKGKPYIGRVKTKKVKGGYIIAYNRA